MKTAEIWLVNLDPSVGDEIKKKRPVVILNPGHNKHLKLAIVVPVTAWIPQLSENPFFVTLEPDSENSLHKKSMIDCFQIRAVSHNRFTDKIGEIKKSEFTLIKKAIALILDISTDDC